MNDEDAGLGFVFDGIFVAFVLSGLALVVVGGVVRWRGAGRGAWFAIAAGAAVLLTPSTALMVPALLE